MSDPRLFIGLMSGTSLDGIDGVLAQLSANRPPQVLGSYSTLIPDTLRHTLLTLNQAGTDELERAALSANTLAHLYADVVRALLAQQGMRPSEVCAIGAHGQTVRHRPDLGYTLQLNAPALLAELSGIDVIADFRSRDIAAGGQGAPLVPPFHAAVFGAAHPRAVLNLGGIANVTLLIPGQPVCGFDTGPANVLLDAWCQRHRGDTYDAQGNWADQGTLIAPLRDFLLASEPWFALPAPKSTGRDLFNMRWLDERLAVYTGPKPSAEDVQTTLLHLTAHAIAQTITPITPRIQDVYVCGGGARNDTLMRVLAETLQRPVQATDVLGVPTQQVEALAFAWLAQCFVERRPAGCPHVTGAQGPRILGALYPA